MIIDVVKIFLPLTISFFLGVAMTPLLTHYLYSHSMWKKNAKTVAPDGRGTPIFNKLHKDKEVGTPKMGGIVIWFSAAFTMLAIWFVAKIFPNSDLLHKLDFLSRDQTWLPLAALLVGAFVGLIDDFMEIRGVAGWLAGGLSLKKRILVVAVVGLLAALWFYFKLEVVTTTLPFFGTVYLGALFIPFFALVTVAVYSGGVIDGIDGLAGGIFSIIFSAYAVIAFYQSQINLAAFCAVIVGGLLAFLWFNIPPARFYMSETGSMALTLALAVVAFMADSVADGKGIAVLPIIAFPLVATTLSDIIQLSSKRLRNGRKVFLVAPLHHHFEALGWPAAKVTMRYWVIGVICAVMGLIVAMVG